MNARASESAGIAGLCFLACALIVVLAYISTLYRIYAPILREMILATLTPQFAVGLFAGIALAGSGLLNVAAKHYFGRARPSLWESIAPESTFSFPSGHAMGSMTLAAVLVLLAWPTRWRWWVLGLAAAFVLMVGASRIYLGVHYPSDILAGWAAALAWVMGVYLVLFRGLRRPWQRPQSLGR